MKIMIIVILSDTHGNQSLALRILDLHGDAGHVIHLGDELQDADFLEDATGMPIIKVQGNCDCSPSHPRESSLELAGRRFLLTHGDLYQVKSGLERLQERAAAVDATVVLFGHTHVALIESISGILYVNPGCLKRGCNRLTYAVITMDNGTISAEILPAIP
jgi:hypothetical protein